MSSSNSALSRDSLFNLKGRVALVTGGGSGIGLMITQALAVNGAKVYIVGRTEEKLQNVVDTYGKDSKLEGEIIPLVGDVSKKEEVARLYDEVKRREKCLCVLVNNAGIAGPTFQTEAKSVDEFKSNMFDNKDVTFEAWEKVYRTNVAQIYFMATAFMPLLQAASDMHQGYSGTVINVSSISGIVGIPQHHPQYNASKAAATHLTKMLANTVAANKFKVRINAISPGVFPSEMTTQKSGDDQKSEIPKENFEGKVPANRPGRDEDMAQAALFLVANQYVNGHDLVVDGGYALMSP